MMNFVNKLNNAIDRNKSLLCVGLDPVVSKLPKAILAKKENFFEFNKSIINATKDLVCCYKPNSAFYEALGADGIAQLKQTCEYILQNTAIPVLLDFKRGDIGSTNQAYADFAFEYLGVDAITLQPYQGGEALEPFLSHEDKGIFILAKTSNPGSDEFQALDAGGKPLYESVVLSFVKNWNKNSNIFMVAGATYPSELATIRKLVGKESPILVPGTGAQGGDLKAMLKAGLVNGRGLIINASRSILYASVDDDFAKNARDEAEKLRNEINTQRS
jgi:orotidine-5'-phosphate decarboxylase